MRIAKRNLKKQSQFVGGQNGTNSYMKRSYDNIQSCTTQKNKANPNPIKARIVDYKRINIAYINKVKSLYDRFEDAYLGAVIGFFRFIGGFSVLKQPFLSMYR